MKRIHIKTLLGTALLSLFLVSCQSILDEQPRAIYTPVYFKTTNGVMGGLTAMYAQLRYVYGQAYYYNTCETGTDEVTYAQSADDNFKSMDLSNVVALNSSTSRADVLWGMFPYINTASGIIENATDAGIAPALIAEARFFRAFDYFAMVQTFGGVPLDLGAGQLKFNTQPVRTSTRNTVPEVYTKGIFPDLLQAVNDLPAAGRVTGGVTKTVARLYLAKAYLTYGWWLENPNNIPTYPAVANRTDPDGHNAAWYYQQAYNVATAAIMDPGSFGLLTNFYDVNLGSNDRNKEILLYADHTQASELFNGASLTYENGNAPANFAGWMMTSNYTTVTSSKTNWASATSCNSVQRESSQWGGRPWTRMCPTYGAITNTFADKTNDSRYDGTFATTYRANFNKTGTNITNATLFNANNMLIAPGDAVFTFLNADVAGIDYSNSVYKSSIAAGVLPGRADYVIAPSAISRRFYPGLWKLGPYRTDNGTGLGNPNAGSTRPFNIAKFSELFLIAAEAAVKGATTAAVTGTYANDGSAYGLVNILRARAGKWRFNNNGNVAQNTDYSAAMVAATPATIDINYILAERSREFYGEGYRWYDLVRTQKWTELSSTYQICGPNLGDHTLLTVNRNITSNYYLRPIPQTQIDGMDGTPADKAAYQNPGY